MDKGFTLVELLVVMAISGVIMTGVYSAFRSQQDSYLAQEQVAEMQQNLRAGLYLVTEEIRMAGYDGGNATVHSSCSLNAAGAATAPGVLAVTANQLDISMDLNGDGDCADSNENLSYYIYTAGDGIDKLGRRDNTDGSAVQAIAEEFEALEFAYLDSTLTSTTALTDVVSVQVSLLARAGSPDRRFASTRTYQTLGGATWGPFTDNLRRRFQATTVQCRNMGM